MNKNTRLDELRQSKPYLQPITEAEVEARRLLAYQKPLGSKKPPLVTFKLQGALLKVKYPGSPPQHVTKKRGRVVGFSQASRKRMLEKVATLTPPRGCVFLSLTYPGDFPSPREAKNHFRAFLERVRRKFAESAVSAIWRMELQKREAPHFHIMFFNMPFWEKEKVQEAWGEIIGFDRPFTRIEWIKSRRGVMRYISKYCAKAQAPTENDESEEGIGGFNHPAYLHDTGRVWGVFNAENLPFADVYIASVPLRTMNYQRIRKCAEHFYAGIAENRSLSFTLFIEKTEFWLELWDRCASTRLTHCPASG